MSGSRDHNPRHFQFPTPSLSPIVPGSNHHDPPTTRSPIDEYESHILGGGGRRYQQLPPSVGTWTTEFGHEGAAGAPHNHPLLSCPATYRSPSSSNFQQTVSPISPTPTHDTLNSPSTDQICGGPGPEYISWQQNTDTSSYPLPVWTDHHHVDHSNSYRPGTTTGTATPTTTLLQYHHPSQLIADCLEPITTRISSYYDSSGCSNRDHHRGGAGSKARRAKMETLRKRRNTAVPEDERRNATESQRSPQSKSNSKVAKRSGRKGDTNSWRSTTAESDGGLQPPPNSKVVTLGGGHHSGLLSPTSPTSAPSEIGVDGNKEGGGSHSEGEERDEDETSAGQQRENKARLRHNRVERKYRNRLNSHFEQLLDVLPPTSSGRSQSSPRAQPTPTPGLGVLRIETGALGNVPGSESDPALDQVQVLPTPGRGVRVTATTSTYQQQQQKQREKEQQERKVSKSEVLDRARMYIQRLEDEHRRLVVERRELLQRWDEYGRSAGNTGTRAVSQASR